MSYRSATHYVVTMADTVEDLNRAKEGRKVEPYDIAEEIEKHTNRGLPFKVERVERRELRGYEIASLLVNRREGEPQAVGRDKPNKRVAPPEADR